MNANELANEGIVTQLAVVHTMLPKVKELIDSQIAEIESLKAGKIRAYDNGYEDGRKPDTNPKLAKTLTISDKDILKIIHDKFTKFGFEADYIVEDIELIEFARAILRKAQEK